MDCEEDKNTPNLSQTGCMAMQMRKALVLIKELTEENEGWQKALITTKEKADKAYHDLACEVEDLRAENERLRADNARYEGENNARIDKWMNLVFEEAKIRAEREYDRRCVECIFPAFVASAIEKVEKEILGE